MLSKSIVKIEKVLKDVLIKNYPYFNDEDGYLELDYLDIDNTEDNILIFLKGRYGIDNKDMHYSFQFSYYDSDSIDFISGKFEQIIDLIEIAKEDNQEDDPIEC